MKQASLRTASAHQWPQSTKSTEAPVAGWERLRVTWESDHLWVWQFLKADHLFALKKKKSKRRRVTRKKAKGRRGNSEDHVMVTNGLSLSSPLSSAGSSRRLMTSQAWHTPDRATHLPFNPAPLLIFLLTQLIRPKPRVILNASSSTSHIQSTSKSCWL